MFDKYEKMGAYHWRECDRGSSVYNPPLVARYKMILDRIPNGRVVDLGAGDGYLAGQLAARCAQVSALEYEPSGVELATAMLADLKNVTVQQGDAYNVPFPDRSFDAIVMADVIEHLHEPERAVREMARIAAVDGVAFVTTPQWSADRPIGADHVTEYTPDEFTALMGKGFESVELAFSWPDRWSSLYRTRVGWRLLRLAGRLGFNPFVTESLKPEGFGQMLAICRGPRKLSPST